MDSRLVSISNLDLLFFFFMQMVTITVSAQTKTAITTRTSTIVTVKMVGLRCAMSALGGGVVCALVEVAVSASGGVCSGVVA